MAVQGAPEGDDAEDQDGESGPALIKSECGPEQKRQAQVRKQVSRRGSRRQMSKNGQPDDGQKEQQNGELDFSPAIPALLSARAPNHEQRRQDKQACHVSQPPDEPLRAAAEPEDKAGGRETSDAQWWAHQRRHGADQDGKLENIGRAMIEVAAARKPIGKPRAEQAFEDIAGSDDQGGRKGARSR